MKLVRRILQAAALLAASFPPSPAAAETPTVIVAGGPEGGLYHRLAEDIRRRLEGQITVQILTNNDCAESLDWLAEETDEIRFALVQQDLAAERTRLAPDTPIRRVGEAVFFNYLHIFARASIQVDSVAKLAGHKIWAGEQGSATRFTASHLLENLGALLDKPVTYQEIVKVPSQPGDLRMEGYAVSTLRDLFKANQLDAAMWVAPLGAPEACSLMSEGRYSLLPISLPDLRRLRPGENQTDPFLGQVGFGDLPADTYAGQPRIVTSLAVPVLLLTRRGTGRETAHEVRAATEAAWRAILTQRSPSRCQVRALTLRGSPPAARSVRLLEGLDHDRPTPWRVWLWGVPALSLVILAVLKRKRIRRQLVKTLRIPLIRRLFRCRPVSWVLQTLNHFMPLLVVLAILLVASMTIVTGLIYRFEKDWNENFATFGDSWWSITLYIATGLENRVPVTPEGRLLGTFGIALGWLFTAVATGGTAGLLARGGKNMPRKLKGHFLILNWNERGVDLVRELHHSVLQDCERTSPILVLTESIVPSLQRHTRLGHDWDEAFEEVYVLAGDPTDGKTLSQAKALEARAVLILADEKHGDQGTIRSILALDRMAAQDRAAAQDKAATKAELHVVVELLDPANVQAVKDLSERFHGKLESVSGLHLQTCVLSQAALAAGITDFYNDLLSIKPDSNEVYTEPIPAEAVGLSFREYAVFVIKNADPAKPLLPVGVYRQENEKVVIHTNPPEDPKNRKKSCLREGDRLVLISYGPPRKNALPVPPRRPAQQVPCDQPGGGGGILRGAALDTAAPRHNPVVRKP